MLDDVNKSPKIHEKHVDAIDEAASQKQFWLIDHSELKYNNNDIIGSGRSAVVYRGLFRQQRVAIKGNWFMNYSEPCST